MTRRQCIVHGRIASEHLVQLFDEPDSLGEALAQYLATDGSADRPCSSSYEMQTGALAAPRLETLGCPVRKHCSHARSSLDTTGGSAVDNRRQPAADRYLLLNQPVDGDAHGAVGP